VGGVVNTEPAPTLADVAAHIRDTLTYDMDPDVLRLVQAVCRVAAARTDETETSVFSCSASTAGMPVVAAHDLEHLIGGALLAAALALARFANGQPDLTSMGVCNMIAMVGERLYHGEWGKP
jgi:hypothetical protein